MGTKISLLWKNGNGEHVREITDTDLQYINDLRLEELLNWMFAGLQEKLDIKTIAALSYTKPEDIEYRQKILDDLIKNPDLFYQWEELYKRLCKLACMLKTLEAYSDTWIQWPVYYQILTVYVECLNLIIKSLKKTEGIQSEGLRKLIRWVNDKFVNEEISRLEYDLSACDKYWKPVKSLVIGLNVDLQYTASTITIEQISDKPLLCTNFMADTNNGQNNEGCITPMRSLGKDKYSTVFQMYIHDKLYRLVKPQVNRLKRHINSYIGLGFEELIALKDEILFYLAGIKWKLLLEEKGWPVTHPEIVGRNVWVADDMYCPLLALQLEPPSKVVMNNINLNRHTNIWILTGANHSGKTTILRAIGINQWLFQLGFHVAAIHINQFTHFMQQGNLKMILVLVVKFPV